MSFFSRIFGKGGKKESKTAPKTVHFQAGPGGQSRTFEMETRCAGCGKDLYDFSDMPEGQDEMEIHSMTFFGKDGKRVHAKYCDRCKKKLDAGLLKPPV